MGVFDTASSTFATQVSVNDAALKQIQAEQTKGLEEMRSGLENIFSGSGMFTALQNLVNNHEKTITDLEDKMKAGSSFSSGDKQRRSILLLPWQHTVMRRMYSRRTRPSPHLEPPYRRAK